MSLKAELHQRIMVDLITRARGSDNAVVLVVDPYTAKIISSSCRMYDIMEAGVVVVENILLQRQPLALNAIYFLHPTSEVIDKLIDDFKDVKKPKYEHAHLFFTQTVRNEFMTKLSESNAVKKIKSFVELNIDFISQESRVFLFNRQRCIPLLYFPSDIDNLMRELGAISKQLVSLCLTLREFPVIRFAATGSGRNGVCKALASFFEEDMKKFVSKLPEWKASEQRDRGTLLIVDRSIDAVAPLMHEYTYQAMVCDLLKVKGELCYPKSKAVAASSSLSSSSSSVARNKDSKEEEEDKSVIVLSEDDPLWVDFRHQHIGEVMHDITEKFREFKNQNRMAALQSEENATVKQMLQAMKDMPQYKQMMQKYHKHMSLAEECMRKFEKRKLKELGELEQDMATGLTDDGRGVDVKAVKKSLIRTCQDANIGVLDKLRLMMIFIITQGALQDAIRKELMKPIHVDLQKAIRNLEKLGVDLSVQSNKPKQSKARLAEFAKRSKTIPLQLMRYVPYLQGVMEQLVDNRLDDEKYPFTSPPPAFGDGSSSAAAGKSSGKSARKAKAGDWKSGGKNEKDKDDGKDGGFDEDSKPLFIVFVLGGVTFSELRSAYEIAEQKNAKLIIGSTNTLVPADYIRELADLAVSHFRQALKAPPADGSQQVIDSDYEGQDGDEVEEDDVDESKISLRVGESDR